MLLDHLKSLFAAGNEPAATPDPDARLAIAELLIHASLIDDDLDEAEIGTRDRLLKERFDLDDTALAALVREAETAHAEAIDFYSFTNTIKQTHSREEREGVLEMVCEIILADGHIDPQERDMAWRIAGLLGFDNREWITILKRVEAKTAH